jgi:phage-related protein
MDDGLKRIPAVFYRNDNGKEPVRDWLQELKVDDRRILGKDIATVEYGWPVGMPLCRSLGGGLWEVRSNISDARIARVIFCIAHGRMILLHAFIKKQQKIPAGDLRIAQQRQKEIEQ